MFSKVIFRALIRFQIGSFGVIWLDFANFLLYINHSEIGSHAKFERSRVYTFCVTAFQSWGVFHLGVQFPSKSAIYMPPA